MIEWLLTILFWFLVVAAAVINIVVIISAVSYLQYVRSMRNMPMKRDDSDTDEWPPSRPRRF